MADSRSPGERTGAGKEHDRPARPEPLALPSLPAETARRFEPRILGIAGRIAIDLLHRHARARPHGGIVIFLGDHRKTERYLRQTLINTLKGYPEEDCLIQHPTMRGVLDDAVLGASQAVVGRADGTLLSTGRTLHPIPGLLPAAAPDDPEAVAAALTRITEAAAFAIALGPATRLTVWLGGRLFHSAT